MNMVDVIRKKMPPELIYFIRKRLQGKDYGIQIYDKNDANTYCEDSLLTYGRNLQFLAEPKFYTAYNDAIKDKLFVSPYIRWRLHVLCWAGSVAARLEGDFVECGVNKGFDSKIIMDYLDFKKLDKTYYLLDTFEGLCEELLTNEEKALGRKGGGYASCIDIVSKVFDECKNVRIIKGRIPDTLPNVDSKKIAFLHIDMNCVVPEIEAMKYFYDKLSKGAIVVFDDYGQDAYVEQKKAHDLFARSKGVNILTLPTGQGLMIKL